MIVSTTTTQYVYGLLDKPFHLNGEADYVGSVFKPFFVSFELHIGRSVRPFMLVCCCFGSIVVTFLKVLGLQRCILGLS